MNETAKRLHDMGQGIWVDNISRETLKSGALRELIAEFSITGLTSNPTIFEKTMAEGDAYDDSIAELAKAGGSTEEMFFALALDDLQQAADLFRPVFDATGGGKQAASGPRRIAQFDPVTPCRRRSAQVGARGVLVRHPCPRATMCRWHRVKFRKQRSPLRTVQQTLRVRARGRLVNVIYSGSLVEARSRARSDLVRDRGCCQCDCVARGRRFPGERDRGRFVGC